MTFSTEWEALYKNNEQISVWPWTDLVSYVKRYIKPQKGCKILEVGFGAGANIPFYKSLEADFYGIEGSKTITEAVKRRYPEYAENIVCADFTKEFPFDEQFDIIIDRSAICFNNNESIKRLVDNIYNKLKVDGYFVSIDWFSDKHSELSAKGSFLDENIKVFDEGYFYGMGAVNFANEMFLRRLLSKFKIIKLEQKIYENHTREDEKTKNDTSIKTLAVWNFIAKKVENNE